MFELKFSPVVIKHLGLSMYSTLPPVLSELITNSYDADASEVMIIVDQQAKSIEILDDGHGMTAKELNSDFLNIGRNKRKNAGNSISNRYKRKITGKKGIGKLSVFGICKEIYVESCKDGYVNAFSMNYDALVNRGDDDTALTLEADINNDKTHAQNYTKIILKGLTRRTEVPIINTADSILTRLNIFDENFKCTIKDDHNNKELSLSNREALIENDLQFSWDLPEDLDDLGVHATTKTYFEMNGITGRIITTNETIKEVFKGITLYARGKLANNPEFYDVKLSNSHAFSYMSGSIYIDYMDEDGEEDFISTARNSLIWENSEATILRSHLNELVNKLGKAWRDKRIEARETELVTTHNINPKWYDSVVQSSQDKSLAKKITDIVLASTLEATKTKELLNYVEGAFEFKVFKDFATSMDEDINAEELLKLLKDWEVIEAREHYRLSLGRVETIQRFERLIENDTLEVAVAGIETMHSFLSKFPWILEPRIASFTEEDRYEDLLREEFDDSELDIPSRRLDFMCRGFGDTLYVIEIKRSQKKIGKGELAQIQDYHDFIKANIEENNADRARYSYVRTYIVGKELKDDRYVRQRLETLKKSNMYFLSYNEMLQQAKEYHKEFIEAYELTNALSNG